MDNETIWVRDRMKLFELLKLHPDWSLRQLGREVGHDAKWVRKWRSRIQSAVTQTLEVFASRSHTPKTPPKRISDEAKKLVGDLRVELSEQFHRRAGPKTIQYGLTEYQKQHPVTFVLPKALSTIAKILRELGYVRPMVSFAHEPVVLPPPMEEWEMDFGEISLGEDGVFEFFIVVDRGTSRLVYLEASEGYNAVTALMAVARLFTLHGVPKRLRFDRDPRLWGSWTRDSYPSPLVRFLRVLGVKDVICPPRRPDLKPFVERCIKTLKYEWFAKTRPSNRFEAYEALDAFPHYYNTLRPHQGRACRNQPPDKAFPTLPTLPELPQVVAPNHWLASLHGRTYRRRVNSSGTIQIDRHTYSVGTAYAKQLVLVHVDAQRREFLIILEGTIIRRLPIQGLYGTAMDFSDFLEEMKTEATFIALHYQLSWQRPNDPF